MKDGARYAYIGSYTSRGGWGITTARAGAADGALSPVHRTAVLPDPGFLALAPGRPVLYAVSETAEGRAAAFSLARPGTPEPLGPPVEVGGAGPAHLAVGPERLYTANYTSGSVSTLRLREDGSPAGPAAVRTHRGGGPVKGRQDGPHAHAVVLAPARDRLLAVDLGTDSVWIHPVDPGPGDPPGREVRLRPGSGPRHLAFHPEGRMAYVVNELNSTLVRCGWDATAGELEPLEETALLPPGTAGENYPSGLAVSPCGTRLYTANRGHDSIAVLDLGPEGAGRPELVGTVPCRGAWPRALALAPGGEWLYVANERSGDVAWFRTGQRDGLPEHAGSLRVPAPGCVVLS
ncbi:lactonase family protein [Streptomyces sodiiphilus]|uniref:Lactonase family protein n=1 Tax=Streptomyces sodiiphilus TaxID=226217 RepID=A0ABP5A8Y2_9ACTN